MTADVLRPERLLPRHVAALLLLVFFAVLVRTAWISDDGLISLRTVMNVTHGNGLTFNAGERVQTYTHPLWLALLTASSLAFGNVYYATFALSIAVSLWVFWLAVSRANSTWQAWVAAAALLSSRAFTDYATSGLETPLVNLLLVVFAGAVLRVGDLRSLRRVPPTISYSVESSPYSPLTLARTRFTLSHISPLSASR